MSTVAKHRCAPLDVAKCPLLTSVKQNSEPLLIHVSLHSFIAEVLSVSFASACLETRAQEKTL